MHLTYQGCPGMCSEGLQCEARLVLERKQITANWKNEKDAKKAVEAELKEG